MGYHTGDTAPALTGLLTSTGQPVDLTGATLSVHIRQPDKAVLTIPATGTDVGAWSAPWPAPIDQAGLHSVEVQVTWSGGGIQTFGPESFYVAPEIT